ncbi:hypothetical protein H257_12064 [Aphanomyces astaci]|uniref:EF-hand domain-containing protein n=1 Tax=Aphanomyces astaci TaxID=112090 RepID=W4G167_APHAT|nr:hypothetical protein H257_12064 [Aphanomyces astaci]ETV73026.1 hypothetical protein H257_12064 [Aphanomyces astaci]|eukprot:XP_009837475.1 hypothetical protein H257_12064 [Aphanomyces astaci]
MLPTFASSYGSDTDTPAMHRPLLPKSTKARAARLAVLSATLIMTSGAGVYGMFDTSQLCQANDLMTLESSTTTLFPFIRPIEQSPPLPLPWTNQTTIHDLFGVMDVDGSGSVNLTELVAYLERDSHDTIRAIQTAATSSTKQVKDEYFHHATCLANAFNAVVPEGGIVESPDQLDKVVQRCRPPLSPPLMAAIPTTTATPANSTDQVANKLYSRQEIIAFINAKTKSPWVLQCTLDALDQEFPSTNGSLTRHDVDGILTLVAQCVTSWLVRCHRHPNAVATFG